MIDYNENEKFDINNIDIRGIDDFAPGPGNFVMAYYGIEKVAEFSFDCTPDEYGEIVSVTLHSANVIERYQRCGIGERLVEEVKKVYPNIIARNLVNNIPVDKDEIHYSDEGLSFIEKCIRKGLIKSSEDTDNFNVDY